MNARHVTSEIEYRSPFGAVKLGDSVTIGIDVWGDDVVFCTLRLWRDDGGERLLDMHGTPKGGMIHYSTSFTPSQTGVLWYSFDIEASDGAVWRYGAQPGWTTGEGAFAYGEPPSFQITVYKPREHKPEWYRNGIVYQVFPDRFFRGSDWRERADAALSRPRGGGPERGLVEDWNTPPTYQRDGKGAITRWDFYGGTLEGVREKLRYLKDLGITVIYLNPIFEAASNHRYDTGDYMMVDPMLGDTESLRRLCVDAAEMGISVILDGVFNHTGADSRYFNKFGTYSDVGAYQSPDSPYRSWYTIHDDGSYESWWGVPDLPAVNEDDPSYHEYICGRNGVVRTWLRSGVRGWRLDVADELPDGFIADIKSALLAERPDGLLLGEVWEDASNKTAYGKLRQYFEGAELDGTMNYPFRTAILAFMRNEIKAPELARRLEQLRENYPRDAFYQALNLLGSHDRERLFTMLGGAPNPDTLSPEECERYRLDDNARSLAKSRLWDAALLQMTLPGVPCIYYGDEQGMEGYRDPYNRAPFPWDGGDKDCYTIVRNALALRKTLPVLVDGEFAPFAAADDVFGFWRSDKDNSVCVLVNGSLSNAHTVQVPTVTGMEVSDVISGRDPKVEHGQAEVFLWPLGSAILHFHKPQRLQKPLERGMGVLCHITSLPNDDDMPGTLGAPARRFIDWLASCGQRYWQVLPVNPTDEFGSPYAGLSAFAGNPALLERSAEEILDDYKDIEKDPAYQEFCEENDYWLTPYATFCAIKGVLGEGPWQSWPARYRSYTSQLAADPELISGVRVARILQFEFQREWDELREYARSRGVMIIGDMPMYVSADSADVWSEPDIFDLDEEGRAYRQAGAPGDSFTSEGQVWGNPTYNWDALRTDGFDWWLRRFERAFTLYDYVRLDHFLGFSSFYSVEAGKRPSEGTFSFGPGIELFEKAHDVFGPLPLIAEDLGAITPAVRALIAQTGIPGMSVVQFADQDVRQEYSPSESVVCCTGTHDTPTLVGWCEKSFSPDDPVTARVLAECIERRVCAVKNDVVIMPLQDVMLLGDEARMNVPGVAEGNWSWQADEKDVMDATERLRSLAKDFGRSL